MIEKDDAQKRVAPVLLYDGGCATCCRIAEWVRRSASHPVRSPSIAYVTGEPGIIVRPVGNDPAELRRLNPDLDIWDAYAVSHVIMPDGSMKLGGEAVAEVLRHLSSTRWFASCFSLSVFGVRPFQLMLNLAYRILDDVRPLLGCESCGRSKPWVRPFAWLARSATSMAGNGVPSRQTLHFRSVPPTARTSPREAHG